MLLFIKENLATIIISVMLAAVILTAILKLIRDKKNGKSSCGCGCESCTMKNECHKKNK